MTDDVFMPYEDDMTGGFVSLELPNQHLYAFNSEIFGEGESDGLWEYSYNRIYYYNVVIDDIMGATQDTEEHKKQLRAEALVGRAFEYLTLVNAYANHYDPSTAATDPGVPLMLDKISIKQICSALQCRKYMIKLRRIWMRLLLIYRKTGVECLSCI